MADVSTDPQLSFDEAMVEYGQELEELGSKILSIGADLKVANKNVRDLKGSLTIEHGAFMHILQPYLDGQDTIRVGPFLVTKKHRDGHSVESFEVVAKDSWQLSLAEGATAAMDEPSEEEEQEQP